MSFVKERKYLGFTINKNGIHLNLHKINAINKLPEPKYLKHYKTI